MSPPSVAPTLLHVVGARPNFMKIAPLLRAAGCRDGWRSVLLHTGQHYDDEMAGAIFRDLEIPRPDVDLGVGSGTHAQQTAAVMTGIEPVLEEVAPDLVVVVGDVNSTLAAALTAAKRHIPVAHVEAGLRSRDRTMPEELNRILTDQLSALCLTPSREAGDNLRAEGIEADRIRFVGNVMIDTLLHALPRAVALGAPTRHGVERGAYAVLTLHRPGNVDDPAMLREILAAIDDVATRMPVVFPVHPRTRSRLETAGWSPSAAVRLVDPVGYLEMVSLMEASAVMLTDSGGLQEETTALGVPCLTLRPSTERPVTITEGTNRLVPTRSREAIVAAFDEAVGDASRKARRPEGWDGHAAERCMEAVAEWIAGGKRL